jgi:dTDP-4-amino-4,6-dideoxygalactose transaminase
VPNIIPPFVAPEVEPVFHLYVVQAADRAALAARLDAAGIETAVHYPTPIHHQPAYAHPFENGPTSLFPEAERAAAEVLSLPIYPELSDAEVETVAAALAGLREAAG